jgi:hypothetical protein
VRSRNPARTPDVRKPPRVPGAPLSGDKSGGSRGNGNGGEWSKFGGGGSAGRNEARSSGGGVGASVGKSKEVSFGGTKSQALRTTDAAQVHSKLPPTVTPEQLPELMAKVKSAAAPEVVAGAKGLWGLVCNGYLELVAKGPALLDSLALIITSVSMCYHVLMPSLLVQPDRTVHVTSHSCFHLSSRMHRRARISSKSRSSRQRS